MGLYLQSLCLDLPHIHESRAASGTEGMGSHWKERSVTGSCQVCYLALRKLWRKSFFQPGRRDSSFPFSEQGGGAGLGWAGWCWGTSVSLWGCRKRGKGVSSPLALLSS